MEPPEPEIEVASGEGLPEALPSGDAEPVDPSRLRGVVVDRETSRPIAGAEVGTHRVYPRQPGSETRTDASGRFDLPVLARDSWGLARARGYGPRTFPLLRDRASPERLLRLELERGAGLAVEVRDSRGRPAADIGVHVAADADHVALDEGLFMGVSGEAIRWDATTDAAGHAELRDLPASVPLALSLYRDGKLRYVDTKGLELTAGARREVRIELLAGTRVVGSVVDPQGRGVPEIELELATELQRDVPAHHYLRALTGAQGEFVFEGVPAGPWRVARPEPTRVTGVVVAEQSIRIAPGLGELRLAIPAFRNLFIEGRVLRSDGQPAPGVDVFAVPEGKNTAVHDATTDASGGFVIGPLTPEWFTVYESAGVSARTRAGEPPVMLRLPAVGSVKGLVVDARTRAAVAAKVELRHVQGMWSYSGPSEDGSFAFDRVAAGRYELRAHTRHGELGALGPIDVRADRPVEGLEIQVRTAATLLLESREQSGIGTVSDARGRAWCAMTLGWSVPRPCVIEPGLAIVRRLGEKLEVLEEVQVTLLRGERRKIVLGRAPDP